jgi:hypothetical protein
MGKKRKKEKNRDPNWKITKAKRTGIAVQVVEYLLSKHKALSSSSSTAKKLRLCKRYKERLKTM